MISNHNLKHQHLTLQVTLRIKHKRKVNNLNKISTAADVQLELEIVQLQEPVVAEEATNLNIPKEDKVHQEPNYAILEDTETLFVEEIKQPKQDSVTENGIKKEKKKVRFADDVKSQQERSNPQTDPQKPKNNSNYYISGGAVIGLVAGLIAAHIAGAAALTPILAAVAVFIAAALVGTLVGER